MREWHARRVGAAASAVATAGVLAVVVSACSLTQGASPQTLPPLTMPGPTAAPVTQPLVPVTQGTIATTTTTAPAAAQPPNDADPTSVAARFLAAVASGDATTAAALEAPGRSPTVYAWAHDAYGAYTQAAGTSVWGQPTCADPSGTAPAPVTASCTWLSTPDAPSLVLVQAGANWQVSHAALTPGGAAAPAALGNGCILGGDNVNFRGGPGQDWTKFGQIPIQSCDVTVFDAVESAPATGDQWRYVEYGGQRGWIVDRAIRVQ